MLDADELDYARVKEAKRRTELPGIWPDISLIAARLAREGWTPPKVVDPDLAETYQFLGWGDEQSAIFAALKHGRELAAAEDDWHRSYTQQAKTSETPVDPDLAEAEKIRNAWEDLNEVIDVALAGIKRGRALAAEAKPGMVWVKYDGSGKCPVALSASVICRYVSSATQTLALDEARHQDWPHVTHYAIITPPVEDAA